MKKEIKTNDAFFDGVSEYKLRKSISKYYSVSKSSSKYYEKQIFSNCKNKKILEYGCGDGSYAFDLAERGATVIGIDISSAAIKEAKRQAKEKGVSNVTFLVMDAEKMQFNDNSFDIVCGTSILHHLNIEKSLKELVRVLKPGCKAFFREPIGYNPLINLFRKLTPRYRVDDEHPLKNKDFKQFKLFFNKVNFTFFHFFSLLSIIFRNTFLFSSALHVLEYIDSKMFKWVPFFKLLAWQVVISLERPKS